MVSKRKWSDEDVIIWAEIFTSGRTTLPEMEKVLKVSHSTLWWCFIHRLPFLDGGLYDKVVTELSEHKKDRCRKERSYEY